MAWITVGYKTREIASFVPVNQPMSSFARNTYLTGDISNTFLLFLLFSPHFLYIIFIFHLHYFISRNIEFWRGLLSVILTLRAFNGTVQLREAILYIVSWLEINQSFKIIKRYFILNRALLYQIFYFLWFRVKRQLYIYLRCFQLEK